MLILIVFHQQHRYQAQDSSAIHSSGHHEEGGISTVNGEAQRRGGQTSALITSGQGGEHLPFAVINRNVMRRDSFEMPQRTIIDSPRPSRSRSIHKTASDSGVPEQQAVVTGGTRWHQSSLQQPGPGQDGYSFHRQASFDAGQPRQTAYITADPRLQHNQRYHHHRQASLNEGMISRPAKGTSQQGAFVGDINCDQRVNYSHLHQGFPDSRQPASFHDMRGSSSAVIAPGHSFHKHPGEIRKGSLTDFRHGMAPIYAENPCRKGSLSDDSSGHYSADSGPVSLMYIRTDSTASDVNPNHELLYSPSLRGREEYLAYSQDIAIKQGSASPISQSTGAMPGKSKRSFPRTNPNYTALSHRVEGQSSGSSGIYKKIGSVDSQHSGGSSSGSFDAAGYMMSENGDSAASTSIHTSQSLSDTYSDPQSPKISHSTSGIVRDPSASNHSRSNSDASHSSSSRARFMHADQQHLYVQQQQRSESAQSQAGDLTDSLSSKGSLRNMQESAISDGQDRSMSFFSLNFLFFKNVLN